MSQPNDSSSVLDTATATAASVAAEFSTTLDSAAELARAAVKLADQSVRERPWQTAAVAAAIGFLVGFLMQRR